MHVYAEFYSIESFQDIIYALKVNATTFKKVSVTCRINFVRQEHDEKIFYLSKQCKLM